MLFILKQRQQQKRISCSVSVSVLFSHDHETVTALHTTVFDHLGPPTYSRHCSVRAQPQIFFLKKQCVPSNGQKRTRRNTPLWFSQRKLHTYLYNIQICPLLSVCCPMTGHRPFNRYKFVHMWTASVRACDCALSHIIQLALKPQPWALSIVCPKCFRQACHCLASLKPP